MQNQNSKRLHSATLEIKEKIDGIQHSTHGTVAEIEEITVSVNSVNEMIDTVATAVEEQSATTKEIAANVTQDCPGNSGNDRECGSEFNCGK